MSKKINHHRVWDLLASLGLQKTLPDSPVIFDTRKGEKGTIILSIIPTLRSIRHFPPIFVITVLFKV